MFLTSEQTGGPMVYSLRPHNQYLALESGPLGRIAVFDIRQLADALGQPPGDTWQGHAQVILIACYEGRLFERLDKIEADGGEHG